MKPILFNTEMVKAIMEGRKTVTRRVLKLPFEIHPNGFITKPKGNERLCPYEPPFQINDILYVRESVFQGVGHYLDVSGETVSVLTHEFEYYADGLHEKDHWKDKYERTWMHRRPSIHMPKEAARIFLKVNDVRAERLKDIDDKGAYLEGAGELNVIYQIGARVCEFAKIWNSTIKPADINTYGWDANPWVWVIEFERITKEQAYELESKKA